MIFYKKDTSSPFFLSISLLLLLGFIWGSGYSLAGLAMKNHVHPLGYSFWQSIGPAVFTTFLCYFSNLPIPFSTTYLRYYFICGLLGIALPNTIMYFVVAKYLTAGITAVLMNTTPVMTYVLALLFQQERFIVKRFLGVLLAVCGLFGVFFITHPNQDLSSQSQIFWVLITLISPLCFSACAIYATSQRPENSHSLSVSAGMLICSSILLTPVVIATNSFYPFSTPFSTAEWVIIIEILLSSLGYILLFQLLKLSGAVYYSLVSGVVALTGLFWGWLIFNETLSLFLWIAISLILIGIVCVTRRN